MSIDLKKNKARKGPEEIKTILTEEEKLIAQEDDALN